MTELLSKDHTILERHFMEFRPFGMNEQGDKIRDVSGVTVRANVDYLLECVKRGSSAGAGENAVQELCRLLNERLRDPVYHVTPTFLRNVWHSYSAEFVAYLREFCILLSSDHLFSFNVGREKHLGHIIQVLGRPFPLQQIYRMIPHFSDKFAKGSWTEMLEVTDHSATLRRGFNEKTCLQYGPYRKRCGELICQAFKGSLIATPEKIHHLPPAMVQDRTCIANGDDWCEWEVTWTLKGRSTRRLWPLRRMAQGKASGDPDDDRAVQPLPVSIGLARSQQGDNPALLSKDHTILERHFMEFRPFGMNEQGDKIRDVSGVVLRGNVDYLQEYVTRTKGAEAAERAVEELCRLLNERLRDPVYHVTPTFLRNVWHSYSVEFLAYMREFCVVLSGDPDFSFDVGREKHITPLIQTLGRPFTLPQIYRMYAYFSDKFGKGISVCEAVEVTNRSAVLRRKFTQKAYEQFGPYRRRCVDLACQAVKGSFVAGPERVHHLPPATVKDLTCIVNGDEWCEWEITFHPSPRTVPAIWTRFTRTPIVASQEQMVESRDRLAQAIVGSEGPTEQRAQDRATGEWTTVAAEEPRLPSRDGTMSEPTFVATGSVAVEDPRVIPLDNSGTKFPGVASSREDYSLLSKDHTILERPFMEFRPFGQGDQGGNIQDASGLLIRDNVEYLEDCVARTQGADSGARVVEELCRRLNSTIRDSAYHVTPTFLKNVWNSYSYEFASYLREFCKELSGDPQFHYNVGKAKHISPLIQTLGRPFPLSQIHKMYPYFAHKYARSLECIAVKVTDGSAILRLKFPDQVLQQFGHYRKACAAQTCESSKGRIAMVPVRVHGLPASMVRDRACIVNGDEYCEWEVTWTPKPKEGVWWLPWGTVSGIAVFAFLALTQPNLPLLIAFSAGIVATIISSLGASRLRREATSREALIHEQVQFVEARHEELREAYLEQERTQVELRRKVSQLTTLHSAGLFFGSTLDRETLLQNVLETLIHQLHYDRAMISRFDPERQVSYDTRVLGVPEDIAAYARSHEVPVTDPKSFEGTVLLQGKAVLIGDVREVWDRLHPRNQQLAVMTNARSVIAVPLKVKDRILGSLTADRTKEHSLTADDQALMETVANQVAIALDNVEAYHQIEALNVGLEAKVRERTVELERLNEELTTANDQLQELDRMKSEFFANVSHEFRTPLTLSLGAFQTLSKLAPSSDVREVTQAGLRNTSRLLFLINELLDLAKFDSGLMELRKQYLDFAVLVRTVAANFESGERRRIHLRGMNAPVPLEADPNQMKKVLYNLLSNAFKFSDPDEGQVWIRLTSENDCVELEVEDNGIGIPHDQLERIFNRFTQVEGSVTRRYEGTGIGLALVKEIATAHQGKITVESELGRGSIFTISLPRGAASADSIVTIGEEDSSIVPISEGARGEETNLAASSPGTSDDRPLLLIADDNADMRAYLARLLQGQYRVVLVKDGLEGLEQARTFQPDLIITDAMMPRMSGYELVKAIRADNSLRSIPVIMLTARAGSEARVESWEAGADDYIAKPFDEGEILARVTNLIRARAQERELAQLQKEKIARFLPPTLADMIMSGEHEEFLKGHRRELSVVFVDLRGFTSFVEKTDPEEVMSILREYHVAMGHLVSEYGGTLERFIGDAVMVYFNDPLPCPNHAEQAVKMAIAMRQAIYSLQQQWKKRGIELGAGIGIATGYATIGAVGFEDRLDYAAIGPVTNLAARLCSEAQHGQILISDHVVGLVKDLITQPIGEVSLKGIQRPVAVSQVIGMRP